MQLKGFIYIVLAAVLWAVSGVASKFLFLGGMDSLSLTKFRLSISSVTLLLIFLVRGISRLKISGNNIGHYALLGFFMASVQLSYLYAISKINVAAAILLQYLSPVLVVLYFLFFKGKVPEKKTLVSVILAVAGCFYVVGAYDMKILTLSISGITGGLISALFFALYSVKGEGMMGKYSPETTLFYALFFGACILLVMQPDMDFLYAERKRSEWLLIFFISTIGTIAPFLFYFKGINVIGSVKANITATLEPISAGVISFLFLGESMEYLQIMGAFMVITAVILLQQKGNEK